jgi:hypothetical protein
MPEPALDLVPLHGVANGLAHDETRTRGSNAPPGVRVRGDRPRRGRGGGLTQMHDEQRASGPATPSYRGREVLAPPQPVLGGQHSMTCVRTQADRVERPLPRRDERIARPARVRMRSRKPWVFARRRLFGWKVRLLTRGLQKCLSSRARRPWASLWLSPCAHERSATRVRCTASPATSVTCALRKAGGSSHRQLDLVTVRAAAPSGQTGSGGHDAPDPVPGQVGPGPAWHICTHPVDNDLNDPRAADYRDRT